MHFLDNSISAQDAERLSGKNIVPQNWKQNRNRWGVIGSGCEKCTILGAAGGMLGSKETFIDEKWINDSIWEKLLKVFTSWLYLYLSLRCLVSGLLHCWGFFYHTVNLDRHSRSKKVEILHGKTSEECWHWLILYSHALVEKNRSVEDFLGTWHLCYSKRLGNLSLKVQKVEFFLR